MTLKYKLATLDELDEPLRALYVEDGGAYRLDVDLAQSDNGIEDVSGLKSALAKERQNARSAIADLARFRDELGDLDVDAARRALEGNGAMLTELNAAISEAALLRSAARHKGLADRLTPLLKDRIKIVHDSGKPEIRVLSEDGEVAVDKDGKFLSLDELVGSMRADVGKFGYCFAGSGNSGGAAPPASPGARPASFTPAPRRSNMTPAQKVAYIKQHGENALLDLPA